MKNKVDKNVEGHAKLQRSEQKPNGKQAKNDKNFYIKDNEIEFHPSYKINNHFDIKLM